MLGTLSLRQSTNDLRRELSGKKRKKSVTCRHNSLSKQMIGQTRGEEVDAGIYKQTVWPHVILSFWVDDCSNMI